VTTFKDIYTALAKLYIDGSDRELLDLGITRDELLRIMRDHEPQDEFMHELAYRVIEAIVIDRKRRGDQS
jgi:hypothetical protein